MDRTQSQWIFEKREAVAERGMVTAMHPLAAAAGSRSCAQAATPSMLPWRPRLPSASSSQP